MLPELEQRAGAIWNRRKQYPKDAGAVVATRLGNMLAAGEGFAGERYGLVTSIAWPRLRPLVPSETTSELLASEDDLRFSVRMSSASLVIGTGLLTFGLLTLGREPWLPLAGAAVLFFVMANSAYWSALSAAQRYTEALAVAFDLHRFQLYDSLGVSRPATSISGSSQTRV